MASEHTAANGARNASGGASRHTLKIVAAYLAAAACLYWVFRDIEWALFWRKVFQLHWGFIALAVATDILSYVAQGLRWHYLLRPISKVSVLQATQAIYVGLFTNEVVPLRVGELVRCFLVARWAGRDVPTVISSVLVERLLDGLWLLLGLEIAALFLDFPPNVSRLVAVLGVLLLGLSALFVAAVLRCRRETLSGRVEVVSRFRVVRWLKMAVLHLACGLNAIGFSRDFRLALLASPLFLVLQAVAMWSVMRASGLDFGILAGAAVMLVLRLGTIVPSAPANVGTYQFFCVLGLMLFGVEKTTATAVSMVAFVILTLPLWALGLFAVSRLGMTLASLLAEVRRGGKTP